MFYINFKKKKLDNIYSKISKQSKHSFYLRKKEHPQIELVLEFFQLNLILILWYMKTKNIHQAHIDYLIKKFIKDIESSVLELGFSDSKIKKKTRIFVENFYGRLYAYSFEFDKFNYKKGNDCNIKSSISRNFNFSINISALKDYLIKNIIYFKKLKTDDFWEMNFFFKIKK